MAGIWPGNIQCVAMLGFDVDGVSSWLNRDPSYKDHPSLMSMAEYGPSVATPRILDMLDSHGVKASFYVPGYVAENHVDLVKDIAARGHEVAHHGYMHEPPSTLSREQEDEVLRSGIDILGGITGERPLGYRSPSWELSEHSLDLLVSHGFVYDSSLMGDDAPYMETAPGNGQSIVEIPYTGFSMTPPTSSTHRWPTAWAPCATRRSLRRMGRRVRGALPLRARLHPDMHPQYIGRPGRLLMLERLINYIKSFPNVEFMRAIDVARLWAGG